MRPTGWPYGASTNRKWRFRPFPVTSMGTLNQIFSLIYFPPLFLWAIKGHCKSYLWTVFECSRSSGKTPIINRKSCQVMTAFGPWMVIWSQIFHQWYVYHYHQYRVLFYKCDMKMLKSNLYHKSMMFPFRSSIGKRHQMMFYQFSNLF